MTQQARWPSALAAAGDEGRERTAMESEEGLLVCSYSDRGSDVWAEGNLQSLGQQDRKHRAGYRWCC